MNNYKKEQINIDTVCKYSTDDIFNILKNYIEYKEKIYHDDGDEIDLSYRLLIVCGFTRYLTDEKLLNHTLDVLRKFDLINDIKNTGIDLSSYSEIDVIKIKAIYYSLTSLYKLNIKALKFPNSKNPILFDIKLKENRVIEHNLQEVLNSIQLNNVFQFEDEINNLPINLQKRAIDKWVRSALKVGYLNDTEIFKEETEYLKGISNHLLEFEVPKPDEVLKNEFDKIFKNDIGFTIFNKMFELYKVETNHLANFSFLFYVMEKEFLVCSQTDFKEFLRNEKYNIEIEKIDSRQWNLDLNKNKKSKLFNSIKERYQSQ